MAFLQLDKSYNPEFNGQHAKPQGPVEIDKTNPMTDSLVLYYPCFGLNPFSNLAQKSEQLTQNGTSDLIDQSIFTGGGTGDNAVMQNSAQHAAYSGKDLTIFVSVDGLSGNPSEGVFGNRNSANDANWIQIIRLTSTQYRCFYKDANNETVVTATVPDPNGRHLIAATMSDDTLSLYVDGELMDSANSGARNALAENQDFRLGTYFDASAARSVSGFMWGAGLFQRALNAAEHLSLAINPAQLLRPSVQSVSFELITSGESITADAGSYSASGTDVQLLVSRRAQADTGSYSTLGSDAALFASRKITADTNTYTVTGTATGLKRSAVAVAGSGTYTISGTAAQLKSARKTIAESGTFLVSGTDVDLIYSPVSGEQITLDPGSYSLAGSDVGLKIARIITLESGVYATSGADIGLAAGRATSAGAGLLSTSGAAVQLIAGRGIISEIGTYTQTGQAVNLIYSGQVEQVVGVVTATFANDGIKTEYQPNQITVQFKG